MATMNESNLQRNNGIAYLLGFLFVAIVNCVGFLVCNNGANNVYSENSEYDEYLGTWYQNSGNWKFELKHKNKATVNIGDVCFDCEWSPIDSSNSVLVGPCGYRNYFIITSNGSLYAYDPVDGGKTRMPFYLYHE